MVNVVGKDLSKVKKATCGSCASILEYTLAEVRSYITYDYCGDSDMVYHINCPCCGKEVYVSRY